jgi:hypothetical protein
MTTAYTTSECEAIEDTVRLYIDGVAKGDTEKLKE